jgi:hypothetical protein
MNEYQQLKHLKSQNIIREHTNNTPIDIDKILETEKNNNKNSSWNKLNKVDKIKKLNEFANNYGEEHQLLPKEIKELKVYIRKAIDRKKLRTLKEVSYDKATGKIKGIVNLSYNKANKKFTIRNADKKPSTLKNISNKKKKVSKSQDKKVSKSQDKKVSKSQDKKVSKSQDKKVSKSPEDN